MVACVPIGLRKEERTAKTLCTIAIGVVELEAGKHTQPFGTNGNGINIACSIAMSMFIEWHGSGPSMTSRMFVDVPRIKSSISGDMGGKLVQCDDGLLIQRSVVGDISYIEGLGLFSQNDITRVWSSSSSHAGAISPQIFFFLFFGSIRLFLVGTAFHKNLRPVSSLNKGFMRFNQKKVYHG